MDKRRKLNEMAQRLVSLKRDRKLNAIKIVTFDLHTVYIPKAFAFQCQLFSGMRDCGVFDSEIECESCTLMGDIHQDSFNMSSLKLTSNDFELLLKWYDDLKQFEGEPQRALATKLFLECLDLVAISQLLMATDKVGLVELYHLAVEFTSLKLATRTVPRQWRQEQFDQVAMAMAANVKSTSLTLISNEGDDYFTLEEIFKCLVLGF